MSDYTFMRSGLLGSDDAPDAQQRTAEFVVSALRVFSQDGIATAARYALGQGRNEVTGEDMRKGLMYQARKFFEQPDEVLQRRVEDEIERMTTSPLLVVRREKRRVKRRVRRDKKREKKREKREEPRPPPPRKREKKRRRGRRRGRRRRRGPRQRGGADVTGTVPPPRYARGHHLQFVALVEPHRPHSLHDQESDRLDAGGVERRGRNGGESVFEEAIGKRREREGRERKEKREKERSWILWRGRGPSTCF